MLQTSNSQIKTDFHFDWYQCTLRETSVEELVADCLTHFDMSSHEPIRGMNNYTHGVKIHRGDTTLLRAFWGGHNGDDPHVISTSDESRDVSQFLRAWHPEHDITRVDVREDYSAPDVWSELYGGLVAFAAENHVTTKLIGDYIDAKKGRTLELGSGQSITKLRLYEKGHECGHHDKDWVRLELQVMPKRKAARRFFASAPPDAFFGASRWSGKLYNELTALDVPRVVSGTHRAPTDDENTYKHLIKQYGPLLLRNFDKHGIQPTLDKLREDILNTRR